MHYVVYNWDKQKYFNSNVEGEWVELTSEAQEFHFTEEAREGIRHLDKETKENCQLEKVIPCRGCQTVDKHVEMQHDAYGIPTGHWCDDCYNSSKYPYRKDRYDYEAYGERLDDEY